MQQPEENTMYLTAGGLTMGTGGQKDLILSPKEIEVLRGLAGRLAELAARTIEDEKKELWHRHNRLEATRPPILCDPENGWHEIITPDQIRCTGDLARFWEWGLRRDIFWAESMGDDRVTEAIFNVPYTHVESGWG